MSKLRQVYMIRHAGLSPDETALNLQEELAVRESCRVMGGLLAGKVIVIFHANSKSCRLTAEVIAAELKNPLGGHGRPLEVVVEKVRALTSKQEDATNKVLHSFVMDLKARSKSVNIMFMVASYDALKRVKTHLLGMHPTFRNLGAANPAEPEIGPGQGYVLDDFFPSILEWRQYSYLIRSGR